MKLENRIISEQELIIETQSKLILELLHAVNVLTDGKGIEVIDSDNAEGYSYQVKNDKIVGWSIDYGEKDKVS